jgi:hypothetical protein
MMRSLTPPQAAGNALAFAVQRGNHRLPPRHRMKLKDDDVKDLTDLFEEALNRAQRLDKKQKIHLRKKIRNELFSLMAWELATPAGIISRWEERLSDVLAVLPFSFKDEVTRVLVDKLHAPTHSKLKKGGQFA